METPEPNDTPIIPRTQLIALRLSVGSVVLAAVVALNALLDVTSRPGGLGPVAWIYAADFALVMLVQMVTRMRVLERFTVPFAAAVVVAWNALFCAYALASPAEMQALVTPSIVLVSATALLLPWGMVAQAMVAATSLATYGGALVFAGSSDLGTLYAFVALLGVSVVSTVGAYLAEQHARLIDEQTANVRAMNRVMREAGMKKDEFLASVSHELRTPLNVVLGYVDLLLDHSFGVLEPPQRDILQRIMNNASNLSHLINDLIDLSRIEAGRLKVEIATVELAPLFTELAGVMDVLLAGHDVAFDASIAPDCGRVSADPDRLKQIVSNLLVNAVKFTERGTIALTAEPCGEGQVAITVSDTGIGIPAMAHRAIFEPFRQVHDRGRRVPGAGIGLSITSRLAHLMGGEVRVDSEPGRGSRFTVTLPALRAAA